MKDIETIKDYKEYEEHYKKIKNALKDNDINITNEVSTKDILNLINHIEKECFVATIKADVFLELLNKINCKNEPKGVNVGYYNDDKFNQEIEELLNFKGK